MNAREQYLKGEKSAHEIATEISRQYRPVTIAMSTLTRLIDSSLLPRKMRADIVEEHIIREGSNVPHDG